MTIDLDPLPPLAAWRHVEAREGFEALSVEVLATGGVVLDGHTTAVEDGEASPSATASRSTSAGAPGGPSCEPGGPTAPGRS